MELERLRTEYGKLSLDATTAGVDPVGLLRGWLAEAVAAEAREPNAMVLSTADAAGNPSSRIVLLRGLSAAGSLRFFTNYQSRKGVELAGRRRAALLFFWPELERQVRIEGEVTKVSPAESDAYFASRPHGSRLAAMTSAQSRPVADRATLEARFAELAATYPEGASVPRPAHWGGYDLDPLAFEFWQGGGHRLHDRLAFTRAGDTWKVQRLAP